MTTVPRTGATTAATLLGLAFTIVLAQTIAPHWVRRAGLDLWSLPAAMAASRTADRESVELNAMERKLFREIDYSEHLAAELVAGTLTLEAAVNEMEPILKTRSGFLAGLRVQYNTSSLRQGVARYLIARISRVTRFDPALESDARLRLECEYALLNGL